MFPCPRRMDVRAAEPAPTIAPKAAVRFIIGIVRARPAIAIGPTPCPMKILSTMLYNDVDTCAMIDGRAYRNNSVDSLSVPNDSGENCVFITATKVQKKYLLKIGIPLLNMIYYDVCFVRTLHPHSDSRLRKHLPLYPSAGQIYVGNVDIPQQVETLSAV